MSHSILRVIYPCLHAYTRYCVPACMSSIKCLPARMICGILPAMARKESYAQQFARKGGKARAAKLTKQQQSEIGRKAAQARWAKKKEKKEK